MQADKSGIRELVWLTRLKQPLLEAQNRPTNDFQEETQADPCPLGCACLPWDFCDCVCHSSTPEKRRPEPTTPVT